MTGSFGSLLNYGTISAGPGGFAIQTDATAVGTVVFNAGIINGQVSIAAGPYARFENSGWMGITAPGAGVTHAISGTFAQTSAGTLALRVAPNGVSDQLVVNGQARLAGTAQALFQPGSLQQELQSADRDRRPHRHLQHAVDAEPAGLPQRQPGLQRDQRDAQPAVGPGLGRGPWQQWGRRRAGTRWRFQQRHRLRRGLEPFRPVGRRDRAGAERSLGQQCQRRQFGGARRRQPVCRAHVEPRADTTGRAAEPPPPNWRRSARRRPASLATPTGAPGAPPSAARNGSMQIPESAVPPHSRRSAAVLSAATIASARRP